MVAWHGGVRPVYDMTEMPSCGAERTAKSSIGRRVWRTLSARGAFVTLPLGGVFTFASGITAEVKVVGDPICEDERARKEMAGIFAGHKCVQWAANLGYVPEGVRPLAQKTADIAKKQLIHMHRRPGGRTA